MDGAAEETDLDAEIRNIVLKVQKPKVWAALQLAAEPLPPDPGEHPGPSPVGEEELRQFGIRYRERRRVRSLAASARRRAREEEFVPEQTAAPRRPGAFTVHVCGEYVVDRSGEVVRDGWSLVVGHLVAPPRLGRMTVFPPIELVVDADGTEISDAWPLVQRRLRRSGERHVDHP